MVMEYKLFSRIKYTSLHSDRTGGDSSIHQGEHVNESLLLGVMAQMRDCDVIVVGL